MLSGALALSLKMICEKASDLSLLDINRFATVSTGWKTASSAIPDVPEPSRRAVVDSRLAPGGRGDMVGVKGGS